MRIRNLFLIFIAICLFVVTGCSNNIGNDEQIIEVQKRVGEDEIYEKINVVTDNDQVLQVKKILQGTNFKNEKAEMSRLPDFQFSFQFKNPKIETKAVLYQMWISHVYQAKIMKYPQNENFISLRSL
ncbi:hypothetical protein CN285_25155 [Bacillus cereus]|uniref:hypothetical protein n=1 Tax=Bacillus paramycoides TaxID=2026194 RepID=UPI000BF45632|nr:hypothetical protein [Bacillus paramycoides]PFD34701.1 hypothetical protein CN285_25155 [Bacillus cereus]PGM51122.1 hypothetical protein CN947_27400 [Bacillus cereus]